MTLSKDTYARVEGLVDELLALAPAQRTRRLEMLAAQEPALYPKVQALLASEARLTSTDFMATPASDFAGGEMTEGEGGPVADAPLPETIDQYRIIRHLGRGGMGTVYLAEQSHPVRRHVALKVTHAFESERDRARFALEAQAMASMQHPNIAVLLDSGITADGTPYVVMELVEEARNLLAWCDEHQASIEERLGLFLQVCAGVAHAHEKGILHRDLKPANLLVTRLDGVPTVKVIDFGIARAFDAQGDSALSRASVAGSPIYMSPEAIGTGGRVELDTRSDLYSLGLVLCQLISGELPFDADSSIGALVERLRTERSTGPAEWLAKQPAARLEEIARARRISAKYLRRTISGDLDAIVVKATLHDRELRYPSPRDLARDIERYLRREPIEARVPHWSYRARRFVQRNLVPVSAVALAFLTLVAFATTMTVQAGRIAAERDRANREAQAKGFVADFLSDLFAVTNPYQSSGETVTAREMLDRGAESIDALASQPDVQATLLDTMGDAYRSLGLYAAAEPLLDRSVALTRELYGEQSEQLRLANLQLATLYSEQGRSSDAEALQTAALEGFEATLGSDDLQTTRARAALGVTKRILGKYEESESLLLPALAVYRRELGDDATETLTALDAIAMLYIGQRLPDKAEPFAREAVAGFERTLGENHPSLLDTQSNLAVTLAIQGKLVEAEALFSTLVEGFRQVAGEEHPATLDAVGNLARVNLELQRFAVAEQLFAKNLADRQRLLGETHPSTLFTLGALASVYRLSGRYDEAEDILGRVIERLRQDYDDTYPATLSMLLELADTHLQQRRPRDAATRYAQALTGYRATVGNENPNTVRALYRLGVAELRQGNYVAAEDALAQSVVLAQAAFGAENPFLGSMVFDQAVAAAAQGARDRGLSLLSRAADAGFYDVERVVDEPLFRALHGQAFDDVVVHVRRNADLPRAPFETIGPLLAPEYYPTASDTGEP